MKKAFSIILAVLLLLSVFVACNSDSIVDDAFDQNVTISFDANGGEGTMAPLKVKKDVATKLPPVGFTKDGNVFVWWEDDDGHAYGDKASVSTGKDIVLHAQWKEVEDITADTTVLTPGKAYRTTEDTTISARITIAEGTGSILLILTKDTTLTAEKGISVIEGQEIYIEGKGTLNATGTEGSAGIGGDETKDGGRIHILDGTIISKGGSDGAGIGGGKGGSGGC